MPHLNICELRKFSQARKEHRTAVYNRILESCHGKIQRAAMNQETRCIYEVPSYSVGLPLYNHTACINHIKDSLRANGFTVRHLTATLLEIDWCPPAQEIISDVHPTSISEQLLLNYDSGQNNRFVLRVD